MALNTWIKSVSDDDWMPVTLHVIAYFSVQLS